MVAVGVHDGDRPAASLLDPLPDRAGQSALPHPDMDPHRRVGAEDLAEMRGRPVGRGVVDDDDLEVEGGGPAHREDLLHELDDPVALVVGGQDDGHGGAPAGRRWTSGGHATGLHITGS